LNLVKERKDAQYFYTSSFDQPNYVQFLTNQSSILFQPLLAYHIQVLFQQVIFNSTKYSFNKSLLAQPKYCFSSQTLLAHLIQVFFSQATLMEKNARESNTHNHESTAENKQHMI